MKKKKKIVIIGGVLLLIALVVAAPIILNKQEEVTKTVQVASLNSQSKEIKEETKREKKVINIEKNPKFPVSQERPRQEDIYKTVIDEKQNIKIERTHYRLVVITNLETNKIIFNGYPKTTIYGYTKNGKKYYTEKWNENCNRAFEDITEAKENGYIKE